MPTQWLQERGNGSKYEVGTTLEGRGSLAAPPPSLLAIFPSRGRAWYKLLDSPVLIQDAPPDVTFSVRSMFGHCQAWTLLALQVVGR